MTIYNTVIDMSSIKTNDDGDFVFDITMTETEDKSSQKYIGYVIMSYLANVDNLASWYSRCLCTSKESAKKILDEIRKLGRDAWIKKYKSQFEIDNSVCHFDISHSDEMWQFTIYDDEQMIDIQYN